MKIELNTNLVKNIFSGTYGTIWEGSEIDTNEYEYFEMDSILEGYQNYQDSILKDLQNVADGIKRVEFTGFYSPRQYNYSNNELEFILSVEDDFIQNLVNKLADNKAFDRFLHNNFTSRDGFISLTPNNTEDWKASTLEGNEQAIGAALSFLLDTDDLYNTIEYRMYEELRGNGYGTVEQC